MDYAGIANWKCKCGRHGSMEHPVNGYCEARIAIEKLESELAAVRERADRYEKALKKVSTVEATNVPDGTGPEDMTAQEKRWLRAFGECLSIAKDALSGEAGK